MLNLIKKKMSLMYNKDHKFMLGDAVEALIDAVVPQPIIDKVKSGGCGCQKRKEALNKFGQNILG